MICPRVKLCTFFTYSTASCLRAALFTAFVPRHTRRFVVTTNKPFLSQNLACSIQIHITVKRSVIRNSAIELVVRRRKEIYVQVCDVQQEGRRRKISGN
jgi:hypothetical protein